MNTDGSFVCKCPPGFIGDGREKGTGCQGIHVTCCKLRFNKIIHIFS